MHAGFGHIVVGRDRAHVRTLLADHPHSEVISASHFFDKVRMLAYLYDARATRDDYAPLILAQKLLHKTRVYPIRFAKNFASLYASCFHGVARPSDVLAKLEPAEEKFRTIFSLLHDIDDAMDELGLETGVRALWKALSIMREKRTLPPPFAVVDRVSLFHLVDLTMLEIEVIKELSRLGVPFDIRFPLDFAERGINTAVNFTAAQFERDHDLLHIDLSFQSIAGEGPLSPLLSGLFAEGETITLSSENCSLHQAPTLLEEANGIAEKILALIAMNPQARIAVLVRTMDTRAQILKHGLLRYGISVRDRKGLSLLKSPAGVLVATLFSARMWGLPKSDLIGLINHPLCRVRIADGDARSALLKLARDLGVDDRMVPDGEIAARYREKAALFAEALVTDDNQKLTQNEFLTWLNHVEEALVLLPKSGRLKDLLNATVAMIERSMVAEDSSVEALKNAINVIAESAALIHDDTELGLSDFVTWLKSELASLTVPRPDHPDANAVEFLLLPEILGRQFDHILIADMAFGRLPHASPPDIVLDDSERARLNRVMERPFLRVFYEDPFEPMPTPPRQALEPFWFAAAIASATKSVHFSVAERDEQEQEQSPGEFFLWLKNHVVVDENPARVMPIFKSMQYQRLHQASSDKCAETSSPYKQALTERKNGFFEGKVGTYSFSLAHEHVLDAFAGRLGLKPKKALSPTMIEAFADCRLRGWLERMIKLSSPTKDPDDIDARAIGQIAHSALERFFEQMPELKESENFTARLRVIIDEAVKDYVKTNFVSNPKVLVCHQEWLLDALGSLIVHLEHERERMHATPLLKEVDFGLADKTRPPLELRSGEHRYLVGGRIDRVDQTPEGFLIIDYKLSSSESLKAKLNPRNVLKGNFQAPIYLRLVAHHMVRNAQSDVAFAFASIRDGELLPPLSRAGNEDAFLRIFNDDSDHSLARSIDEIFSPVMQGEIPANRGEHCTYCDFSVFCRRGEWEHHGR